MANDELLRLTGASTGVAIETITSSAAGGGGYRYVGPNRVCVAKMNIGGAFDATSGDERMGGTISIAGSATGASASVVATFASVAVNNRNLNSTNTQDSVGDVIAPYTVSFTTTSSKPYVGWTATQAGDTPSIAGVNVELQVSTDATLRSGT
jgi:hypothetical protein